ncbi:MAG: aldo/keto reductase [Promethearchaeia archaeon]|nr:MAG: aldo/keto reductase [Candidatus Lokiarchaeia archaeon]
MKYRNFHTLARESSVLGFGCMRLPTVGEGDKKHINEELAINLLRLAIDNGINYIDTAWPYHNKESETVVGKALRDGYREKVILVTKAPVWEYKNSDDFENYLRLQLEKLQTDHIDLYLLHALNKLRFEQVKKLKILEAAEKAKNDGLINHIGFSFHGNYKTFCEILDAYPWDACQIQFNYMDVNSQATEKGLKYAGSKSIPVIVMEPLLGGKLVRETEETKKILENAPVKRTLAEWALQFVWNYPEVKVVLSGMNTEAMILENVASANRSEPNSMNPEEFEVIKRLRSSFQNLFVVPCTRCEYCMPCPSGVNIPMNLRVLNEAAWTGSAESMQGWFDSFAQTPEELEDKPNNGAAQLCIECMQCLDKCPQGIQIPDQLKKVVAIYRDHQTPKSVL